ncbi:uncharacterized protein LODBEIA_P36520 [Lodderomyces beijingensis]|uniref:Uncharacterized protein n=1 Tax=Lodderomyces beijingensis TaxID=1775926 RepID=A0ABP0ZMR9_9ASCO
MTHLAPSTIETISKTLSLYNTLPLAKIYIFYNKKPRLQYVGSYAVSSHDGDDNDNTEEEVERVEAMVRELDLRHGEKLIDFSFDGDSYVGHLKGDFVFVYFLVGSTPR